VTGGSGGLGASTAATEGEGGDRAGPAARVRLALGLIIAAAAIGGSVAAFRGVFLSFAIEHLLLTLVGAPLIASAVSRGAAARMRGAPFIGPILSTLGLPWRGFALFHVTTAVLLLPPVLETFHRSPWLWVVHRLLILGAAIFLWWPLAAPAGDPGRLPRPMQMLYAFLSSVPTSLMAVILARANSSIYGVFDGGAALYGVTPHHDQMLGALLMWIPALFIYFGAISWAFWRWQKEEPRQ
jgi:putative membrane protein